MPLIDGKYKPWYVMSFKPSCAHRDLMLSFLFQAIVHFQAKDLNAVSFSRLRRSTPSEWLKCTRSACRRHWPQQGLSTLEGLPGGSRCSPAHNCYPPTDRSWPCKHAHHGHLHSEVFKTKGNLYTRPVFQPVCYLFCILSHVNFTDTGLIRVFRHLDTPSWNVIIWS